MVVKSPAPSSRIHMAVESLNALNEEIKASDRNEGAYGVNTADLMVPGVAGGRGSFPASHRILAK